MNEPLTTICGNVVSDVERWVTSGGVPVARFRIACNPRSYSRDRGEWVQGESQYYQVTVWRSAADNAHMSIRRGQPIVVFGKVLLRKVTREIDGESRSYSYTDIEALSFGPDLSRCQAIAQRPGHQWGDSARTKERKTAEGLTSVTSADQNEEGDESLPVAS